MAADVRLRLMTFNVQAGRYSGTRLAKVADRINELPLDLLLLQELNFMPHLLEFRARLVGLPHCAFQNFGLLVSGGLVTFSREPIRDSRFVSFGCRNAWPRPSVAQWLLPKGALIANFDLGDQGPCAIINSHLQHNPTGDWSRRHRYTLRQQLELQRLTDLIAQLPADHPVIVAGDLNVPPGGWLLPQLLKAANLMDVMGSDAPSTFRCRREQTPQAIDHVLLRPGRKSHLSVQAGLRFVEEQVQISGPKRVHLSDHYAIEAAITLSSAADIGSAGTAE